jgi:hypothetical protein
LSFFVQGTNEAAQCYSGPRLVKALSLSIIDARLVGESPQKIWPLTACREVTPVLKLAEIPEGG